MDLVAVLERSKSESMVLVSQPDIVRDYEQLLARTDLDLIVINTPSGLHFTMAQQALKAGKHVVVEKPFTATLAEAKQLKILAEQCDKEIFVYHNRRLESGFLTSQQLLSEGRLGNLCQFKTSVHRYRQGLSHKLWKEHAGEAAGLFFDFAPHLLDECLQLFGRPRQVYADLHQRRADAQACDDFVIRLNYGPEHAYSKRGFSCELSASMLALISEPHYRIHGDCASYEKIDADVQEARLVAGVDSSESGWNLEAEADWGRLKTPDSEASVVSVAGDYQEFYDNVASVLQNKAEPLVQLDDAIAVMELLEACLSSAEQGRTITFN